MRAARRRRSDQGQVLPLVALAAVVLFAFAALALDGAFAFNDRRGDQSMADFAALAGAMALTQPVPDAGQQFTARQKAVEYLQRATGTYQDGNDPCALAYGSNIDPVSNPCPVAGFSVWVTTPTPAPVDGYDPNHLVQVRLSHPLQGRLLSAAGMSRFLTIGASAVAVNPKAGPLPVHIVWSTSRPNATNGGGNTFVVTGTTDNSLPTKATAQVDDGANGTDCPPPTPNLDVFSAEKIHAQGKNGTLNVNGLYNLSKVDHDQNNSTNVLSWWSDAVPQRGVAPDLDPHFMPPTDNVQAYANQVPPDTLPVSLSADGLTVTFNPGHYTSPLVVQPVGSYLGVSWGSTTPATTFVFNNGVYWFDGAGVTFPASASPYQVYSQDYDTVAKDFPARPTPDPNAQPTTTDGVEFYLTGQATFGAFGGTASLLKKNPLLFGGTINLQAPTQVAESMWRPITGTTAGIGIFVDRGDTGDTDTTVTPTRPPRTPGLVNTPVAFGDLNGYAPGSVVHMHGVVYVQNSATADNPAAVLLTPSSQDLHKYTVQGAVIAPYIVLDTGAVSTTPSGPPFPLCSAMDDTKANPGNAGKLVQFDPQLADILRRTEGAEVALLQ